MVKVRAEGGEVCASCERHVERQCWVAQVGPGVVWHWTCHLQRQKDTDMLAEQVKRLQKVQREVVKANEVRSIDAIPSGAPGLGKRA